MESDGGGDSGVPVGVTQVSVAVNGTTYLGRRTVEH